MPTDRLGPRLGEETTNFEQSAGGEHKPIYQLLNVAVAISLSRMLLLFAALAGLVFWMASSPSAALAQEPEDLATLQIVTVPPTAGLPIEIGAYVYQTDGQGILTVDLPEGVHFLAAPELVQADESTRILFRRWKDSWDRVRVLELKRDKTLSLGVIHQHPVSVTYTDYAGNPVDGDEIERADFVNSRGDWVTFSGNTDELAEDRGDMETWLSANRLRRAGAGLLSTENSYTVASVVIRGQQTVQRGTHSFTLESGGASEWTVPLNVFPLEVEVTSLLFSKPLDREVRLHELAAPDGPALYKTETVDGTAYFPQVPRGDYEVRVSGWLSRATPTILTGPKTERISMPTPLLLAPVVPLVALACISLLLWRSPHYRLRLLFGWVFLGSLVAIAPALISLSVTNDAISATATPLYSSGGELIGMNVQIENDSPLPVSHTYCKPDFEMRVPLANNVWSASFESPDFHDVELGECRITTLDPGVREYVFASTPGQEWSLSGDPLPPGDYTTLVRIFGIPSPELTININSNFPAEFSSDDDLGDPREIPFAPPEED